jgi:predicted metal-dependent hydrolase
MDDPKNSKNINVATLSSFRITYKEELLSDDAARDLPQRVQALRGGLLSWNGRIIKEYIETKEIQNQLKQGDISSEYIPSEYIYTKTDGFLKQEADEMGKRLNPEVDLALHIRHEATRLHKEIAQEKRWEALLLDTVFKQLKYRTAPTRLVAYIRIIETILQRY